MNKWRVEYIKYASDPDFVFIAAKTVEKWVDPNNEHNRTCIVADGVIIDMQYVCTEITKMS